MNKSYYSYEPFRDRQSDPSCFYTENNNYIAHFHSSIELIYVCSGEMRATIDGENLSAKQNEMFIIPCFSIHSIITPLSSGASVLIIPLSYLGPFEKLFQQKTFSTNIITNQKFTSEIYQLLLKMQDKIVNPLLLRGMVYEILGLIIEEIPLIDSKKGESREQLQSVLNFLQNNFTEALTLETVASQFGYSKSRFSHIFNENVGCSFPRYLNMLRTKNTMKLVQEEQLSVIDAVVASGYESLRSFYRAFNQIYGCNPSDYSKNQ